jgi:hypothetical protein
VQLVHNSKLSLDLLVKQFVESQAAAGIKVAKARVKDRIKEISSMRRVGKAPLYTVKPEVLQAVQGAGAGTAAASGVETAAGLDAEAEPIQVDGQLAAVEGQAEQQQQQEPSAGASAEQSPDLPGATAAAGVGHKRPQTEAAQDAQQPDGDKQQAGVKPSPAAAAAAGSCPPAKKQRPTPAAGIERFFGAPSTAPKPQQQPAAAKAEDQTQQQQQHGTPPSTPKHKLPGVPSLHHSELQSAAAAAGGSGDAAAAAAAAAGGAEGACDGAERSGALPMLTPPSDAAAAEDRPGKGRHSPVPFRLNSLSTVQEAAAATGAGDDALGAPAAVTGTAGNAVGTEAAAAAAAAGHEQQQQQKQPARQNISHIFKRQQQLQQERGGAPAGQPGGVSSSSGGGGLLGGSSSHLSPAAAAAAGGGGGGASHTLSRLGARAAAGGSSVSPPGLPEDGSAPSGAFWKQLVSGHTFCVSMCVCLCQS